jgi:hypothetical protein
MPKQQFRPAVNLPYGAAPAIKRAEVWVKTAGSNPSWFSLVSNSKTGYLNNRDDMMSKGFTLVAVVVTGTSRFNSFWWRL